MKKHSLIDWLGFIAFRVLAPVFRIMPLGVVFFLGRLLGGLLYCLDARHRAIAYTNLKTAFGDKLCCRDLKRLTRDFYRAFGQNLIEIFIIPRVGRGYIEKYADIEGRRHIDEAFKRGKGVILLGIHEGSWELSNVVCANLGFPLAFFIREQKFSRLNNLLNIYRTAKGCRLIQKKNQTRQLIQILKANGAVGMTADQGGKTGVRVDFFGKDASMATGAVRLALKYDAAIIPGFYARLKGPYMKLVFEPAFELTRSGDLERDIHENLQRLIKIYEGYLKKYPREYIWFHKIWKYSRKKNILVLSDGRAGHLRQSEAVAQIAQGLFLHNQMQASIDEVEVNFKNRFSRYALLLCSLFSGRYSCQGCMGCLKKFIDPAAYAALANKKYDLVISCGSGLAPVNHMLAIENLARSVVVMRPAVLSTRRFDLVIMPQRRHLLAGKNIALTEGALNLVDDDYLRTQSQTLRSRVKIEKDLVVGMLIGGDNKDFHLEKNLMQEVIRQVKLFLEEYDAEVLITTSRRTPKEIEKLFKDEFTNYRRCRFLVVANEKNDPYAVGGILGLSRIIVTSPESISMVSEAASSGRYTLVFNADGLGPKHRFFLQNLAQRKNIYLADIQTLQQRLGRLWQEKPEPHPLNDKVIVSEALSKLL